MNTAGGGGELSTAQHMWIRTATQAASATRDDSAILKLAQQSDVPVHMRSESRHSNAY